jgi:hypothetical protein
MVSAEAVVSWIRRVRHHPMACITVIHQRNTNFRFDMKTCVRARGLFSTERPEATQILGPIAMCLKEPIPLDHSPVGEARFRHTLTRTVTACTSYRFVCNSCISSYARVPSVQVV